MKLVDVDNATFADAGLVTARGVSLQVNAGDLVVVHGGEQSGKSTLLRGLLGFVPLTSGRARLFDVDIAALTHDRWMELRVRTAYASWTSPLLANLTVFDNLAIPLLMRSLAAAEARASVERALARYRLEDVANKRPHEILGEKLRAALMARALLLPAELLLVDDPPDDEELDKALEDACADGKGVIVASRDPERFRGAVQIDLVGAVS